MTVQVNLSIHLLLTIMIFLSIFLLLMMNCPVKLTEVSNKLLLLMKVVSNQNYSIDNENINDIIIPDVNISVDIHDSILVPDDVPFFNAVPNPIQDTGVHHVNLPIRNQSKYTLCIYCFVLTIDVCSFCTIGSLQVHAFLTCIYIFLYFKVHRLISL